jgi:transcriptional regulator with XRE-family HTH domain
MVTLGNLYYYGNIFKQWCQYVTKENLAFGHRLLYNNSERGGTMTFGDYIKGLRKSINLSQRALAEKAGVSSAEISRLESGERKNPSPSTVKAIAGALGVSYEDLMARAGYMEKVISRGNFEDVIWEDETGTPVDTFRRQIENITRRDKELISILERAVRSSSEEELETIKKLLSGFIGMALSESEKLTLRTIIDSFTKK